MQEQLEFEGPGFDNGAPPVGFRVFTKKACGPCVATKQWLMGKGIPATRVRLVDCDSPDAMLPEGVRSVPFVQVVSLDNLDNPAAPVVDQWSGFQPPKLEQYK